MTRINRKPVSKFITYTVKELSELLKVDVKTIQRWIESGLKIVPGCKKPILMIGSDVKEFLKNKDSKKKVSLKRGEFYCFTCKAPRRAKKGSTRVFGDKKNAVCSVCSGKMNRIIKPSQKDYQIPSDDVQMSLFLNKLDSK